ncbi:Wzz/FepE/Etk N-terminal domain-containing protein [Zhaonella formicivorans]|uniref:Wzz/FepE/Etk N-terminal domain-containing protein n=1 Tax=Zhaonella formicivorans TaxID=2528593 RepID=UPI0010DCB80B|nr:Wzz/FepE/Etk N-terminal domain-containing protein [Zhaonella formicivorans]
MSSEKEISLYQEVYDEIDLRDIIMVIWRRRKTILTIFLVTVIAATAFAFLQEPVYKMSSTISLGNYNSNIYTNPAGAKEVLLSDNVLMEVIKQLGLDVKPEEYRQFKEKISVDIVKDTSFIQIAVKEKDRVLGKKIIEQMVAIYTNLSLKDYTNHEKLISQQLATINQQLKEKEEELNLAKKFITTLENDPGIDETKKEIRTNEVYNYLREIDSQRIALLDRYLSLQKEKDALEHVKVINPVRIPQYPVAPQKKVIVAVAMVLGLMVGLFVAFIQDYFKRNPIDFKGTNVSS